MKAYTINKDNHQALREYFIADTRVVRQGRAKATAKKYAAREMRKGTKDRAVLDKSFKLTDDAVRDYGYHFGSRGLSLALAFLNGTAYERCEPTTNTPAPRKDVVVYLQGTITPVPGIVIGDLVDAWIAGKPFPQPKIEHGAPIVVAKPRRGVISRLRTAIGL